MHSADICNLRCPICQVVVEFAGGLYGHSCNIPAYEGHLSSPHWLKMSVFSQCGDERRPSFWTVTIPMTSFEARSITQGFIDEGRIYKIAHQSVSGCKPGQKALASKFSDLFCVVSLIKFLNLQ